MSSHLREMFEEGEGKLVAVRRGHVQHVPNRMLEPQARTDEGGNSRASSLPARPASRGGAALRWGCRRPGGKRPSRKIPAGEPFSEDDETGGR